MNCLQRRLCQLIGSFCLISLVNGLRCFECTLSDGSSCLDFRNKTGISVVDCQQSIFTQAKTKNEEFICIYHLQQNSTKSIYTRRCGLKSQSNICNELKEENNGYSLTECNTCQEDFCNSSVMMRGCSILFLLSVVFLLFNK